MKTIKVSEASDAVLDWMVAKCEGVAVRYQPGFLTYSEIQVCADWDDALEYTPSTDWAQGGPIIERERIDLDAYKTDWEASMRGDAFVVSSGPTPLIAAMRCLVASKLGDTVNVPEELLV